MSLTNARHTSTATMSSTYPASNLSAPTLEAVNDSEAQDRSSKQISNGDNSALPLLPYELWRIIAHKLADYHDLTKLRRVSKMFRSMIQARDFDDAMYRLPLPTEVYYSTASSSTLPPPKSADVDTLVSMSGYSHNHCVKALMIAGGNLEVAADWLFSHPDLEDDVVDVAMADDDDLPPPYEEIENISTHGTNPETTYPTRPPTHFIVLRRQGQIPAADLPAAVHTLHPFLANIANWMNVPAPRAFHSLLGENLGRKEDGEAWTLWDIAILEHIASVSGHVGEVTLARLHGLYTALVRTQDQASVSAAAYGSEKLLGELLVALKEQAIVPPLEEWRSVSLQYVSLEGRHEMHEIEGEGSTVGDFLRVVLESGTILNTDYWESLVTGGNHGTFRGFKLQDTHRASIMHLVPHVETIEVEEEADDEAEESDGDDQDIVEDSFADSDDEDSDDE